MGQATGGRFARGWAITKISVSIVQREKGLMLVPFISAGIALLIVGAAFAAATPLIHLSSTPGVPSQVPPTAIILYAIGAVLAAAVMVIGHATICCRVMAVIHGQTRTNGQALSEAMRHFHRLVGWATLNLAVREALSVLESQRGIGGMVVGIVARLIGVAWRAVTFFVVPVILFENLGVFAAVKRSSQIIRKRWGEGLTGVIVIGLVFFVLMLPIILVAVLASAATHSPAVGVVIGFALYIPLLALNFVGSSVFNTALYSYAVSGQPTLGFSPGLFDAAFRPRRQRASAFGGFGGGR